MAVKKRTSGRQDAVIKELQKHRNVEVNVHDLAADLDMEATAVSSTVSHLRKTLKVDVPRKGWYVYRGPARNGSDMVSVKAKAQVVSLMNDGRVLLTIDGVLYIAEELEVS